MASELKPCPFCGGADVNLYHSAKTFMSWVSCKSCGLEAPSETGITDAEAITYWNTRPVPAATNTGLVTVGYVREDFIPNYVTIWSVPHGNSTVAVCLRSQAEELLAAERAKVRHWQEQYTEMHSQFIDLAKSAEADNAAQDARIKAFVEYEQEAEGVKELYLGQIEAIEAKLAAAQKALEPFADIADLIDAETEGMAETDELVLHFHDYEFAKWPVSFFRKARAVLGGKAS
ncbi:Lar family restriction alleviation protein [Brucella tritici]|uniref:Lar family restriction alleviation protein n=1 Tax=Brucella tritici TaxID=94626 RepID=UPI00200116DD|nr:Lar family restriction alleviation protein [Brucella tritici]